MIGNREHAALALYDNLPIFNNDGSARVVYLIDNVIYKVDREYGANEAEWGNYCHIDTNNLPPFLRIPKMSMYRLGNEAIIACEYVKGIPTGECFDRWAGTDCTDTDKCLPENIENAIRRYVDDLAWGNVIVCNEVYYMVDLEC